MTRSARPLSAGLFCGAFALYIATATSGAFWLDSSELAAAGATLGIPHAPGHPLYVIFAHAASLLPIGSIGFRIALLSALCGALSVVLLYRLTLKLDRCASDAPPIEGIAVCAAVSFAVSDALWFQSVRAEVYTLNLVIALGLMNLAVAWAQSEDIRLQPLAVGAFVLGLGAGNHHLLLLAACPALAVLLLSTSDKRRAIWRGLPMLLGATLFGLLIYALLPLRAMHDPVVNYGHPDTLSRFLDVVMAKVFTGSVTGTAPPVADNVGGALDMFLGSIGPVWLVAGVIGALLLTRHNRLIGGALCLAIVMNLGTKLLMVLDPTNPDAAGYFQLAMALTLSVGSVALARLMRAGSGGRLAAMGTLVIAALLTGIIWPGERANLSTLRGPETVDTALQHSSPPGALVMTSFFAHHFNSLYQRTVAGYRPDIVTVHQGLEDHIDGGRPFAASMKRRAPDLSEVLDAKLRDGGFPTAAVAALAQRRPVLLEPTLGLPVDPERLRYRSGLFAIEAPSEADVEAQERTQHALLTALPEEARTQRETLTTLAMTWLPTVVTRLRQGSSTGATHALTGLNALSPGSRWVALLEPPTKALRDAERRGDAGQLSELRTQLRQTDFTGLFGR
ncbi:MAG: DUF2723 domain-containing protein [Myxococcota bacterium]